MGVQGTNVSASDIDVEKLHAKYIAERDKRLKADRDGGYVPVDKDAELASFAEDPFADPNFTRAPIHEEIDVLIVGGGLSGLLTGVAMRKQNIESFRIVEKGGNFGGVWYWNRYPGAACDVESYTYMPLLEETGYIPTQRYADTNEIREHCERIAKHFNLYPNAYFQTAVTELNWDEASSRWLVETNRGDRFAARFICLGTGGFSVPKVPGIPGVKSFKGEMFHTARWNYEYTKGNHLGGLTGLQDKRVGVIGTGASAIQSIPHLAEWSKELFVFQRTPVSIDVRGNRPTDPDWAKSLKPGWQEERIRNFDAITTGVRQDVDLIEDGWSLSCREIMLLPEDGPPIEDPAEIARVLQPADYVKMEKLRRNVDAVVKDPATAEALKPYFNMLCKRPGFHDFYLEQFNRPNVHLVDTKGLGVERITENAVVVGGKEYPVDCIVLATGFEALVPTYQSGRFTVRGAGGQSLKDKWDKQVRTLHGIMSEGFPNMFVVVSLHQHGIGVNVPSPMLKQSEHISKVVSHLLDNDIVRVDVKPEAEQGWIDKCREKGRDLSKYAAECTPGYYNLEGSSTSVFGFAYGGGPLEYYDILKSWRNDGGIERDLELKRK